MYQDDVLGIVTPFAHKNITYIVKEKLCGGARIFTTESYTLVVRPAGHLNKVLFVYTDKLEDCYSVNDNNYCFKLHNGII